MSVQRVALLGGIYSNHHALRSALADCRRRGLGEIYCLGDLGAFGPHPDRVFPLLADHGVRVIAGNYDDSLARGLEDCQCGYTDPRDNHFARLSYEYTYRNTSRENKAYLGTLPREIRWTIGGRRVLLCHGSPRRAERVPVGVDFAGSLSRAYAAGARSGRARGHAHRNSLVEASPERRAGGQRPPEFALVARSSHA